MALRYFETEDAEYYLGLGRHSTSSEPIFRGVDFSELDFMVFEDCNMRRGNDFALRRSLMYHPQYEEVYRKIERENPDLSVYGVDVKPSLGLTLSELIGRHLLANNLLLSGEFEGIIGGLALSIPLLQAFNSGTKEIQGSFRIGHNVWANLIPGDPSYRDAVTAKKTREYLVPKHKQDGRKVRAGLLYGAFHSGIETKLRHPQIADATIYLHHNLLRRTSNEELNEVREVKRNNLGNLCGKTHDCRLFT